MAKKQVKKINQDRIESFLRKVEQNKLEIQEKEDIAPIEIDNPSPEQIFSELKKSECTLFFYKMTDGSSRRMRCTLNQSYFSEKYRENSFINEVILSNFNYGKHGKANLLPVWDLTSSSWKSFYLDRVYKLIRNEKTDIQ